MTREGEGIPTQTTWRQLIRLLLSYKGEPTDIESIRAYQRDKWGSSTGETCVVELSGLASPNMRTPQDRTTFLATRIERIREEVLTRAPEFIITYGLGYRETWKEIAGGNFDSNEVCRIGKTVVAIARHPVTVGLRKDYWVNLGRSLREIR